MVNTWASDAMYDSTNSNQNYWLEKNYEGWDKIIRPCVERAIAKKHEIQQIKSKFGSLRFYYRESYPDEVMSQMVRNAEKLSHNTCYTCGGDIPKSQTHWGTCRLCKDGFLKKLEQQVTK